MSSVITRIGRLFAALFVAEAVSPDPDNMSLSDWADLPAHHPVR